ncbi:MAG: hypothetical protein IJA00_02555 [Bacteroidaceae bacterium]|nr:hypothetical protein [Bacteroidaceae bacterium]
MKHILILLISIVYSVHFFAQENLYSFVNGNIQVRNTSFVSLNVGNYTNITPYSNVATYTFTSYSETYELKLQNYKGWETDGGDFRVIRLYNNGNLLLEFADAEAWRKPYREYSNNYSTLTDYCIIYPMENDATALIFEGYPWSSQAPLLTIIVIKDNDAKVVFNQSWVIESFIPHSKGFELIIEKEYLEYDNSNSQYLDRHRIYTTSDGRMKFEKVN